MDGVAAAAFRVSQIQQRVMPEVGRSFSTSLEKASNSVRPSGMFIPWDGAPVGAVIRGSDLQDYLGRHAVETRNGHLEGSGLLVNVSGAIHAGSARLLEPAARAWEAMRSAAARDGVDLRVIDTYRSYETQARAHAAYLAGDKPANVLPPGTSEHGNGLAIDVSNGRLVGPGDREWEWLNANGERFGWHPISNESWHWEFRGTL